MRTNPKIEHIIVLMMENRSFDHILGYMAQENPKIDGIVGNDYTNLDSSGEPYRTTDGAAYRGQLVADPGHDVDDVYFQMFGVNLIPHTWDVTTLGQLKPGDPVNLEIDMLARYLARWQETA